ncbi:MAG: DUF1622 domain-containing protein [Cyanobacteriota bacterium]|nr:DUF1622 domain-containing protein [Cyanobacteriota bacterium]
MEWIEHLEDWLAVAVSILKVTLEAVSVFCILLGLIATLQMAIAKITRRRRGFSFLDIRLRFGTWLALALEFQLAADILSTTVAPSFQALGKLGAIAVIRTFLNFFLNKELEAEAKTKSRIKESQSPQK